MEQPAPSANKPSKTYHGNCHCGAVRFTVKHPSLETEEVSSCNCSICTRNGYLFIYPPKADLVFLNGSDAKLKSYHFGNREIAHMFCPECGTSVSAVHPEHDTLAVNVRTFADVDFDKLIISKFEGGKDLDPPYAG